MFSRSLVIVAVVGVFSSAQADTIFVDAGNCPGPGDGSVGDPYCSIQTAIDNAVDTDEIVVAPGTYFETISFLGKAVTLRSSDGQELTIIDAQGSDSVVTCNSGEGPATVLEGFTITGGSAFAGGGMLNANSSPTVADCTFSGNVATGAGGGGMYNNAADPAVTGCTFSGNDSATRGGGMYNNAASPTVTGCTFSDNGANDGGGMYNNDGSPVVTDCTFTDHVVDDGGGMFNNSGASPTVINCTFIGNQTDIIFGTGGGMSNFSSSPTVIGCTFSGNSAGLFGGGMSNLANSVAAVIDCVFIGNFGRDGGGITNGSGGTLVTRCLFIDNSAESGGGVHNGPGDPTLTGCIFQGNFAFETGGGLTGFGSTATVANCTFRDNSAKDGGGVYGENGSRLTVTNCIVWDNSPDQIVDVTGSETTVSYSAVQGGRPGPGNIAADPMFVDPGNGDLRLSPDSPCIDAADNTAVPVDITTDLEGNPRFLEVPETPDTGNGTLPIVDMGAYESLGGGCLAVTSQEVVCHADGTTFTVNIEGLNACTGGTTQVTFTASDGAVGEELCFTAVIISDGGFCCSTEICVTIPDCTPDCDLNGDGIVGMADFLALLGAWGSCSDCGTCPADFDGDCSVGILDLLILLGNWG